ncbi:fatty acid desaturase [Yersinia mollaretii]|uniref:fatty acid desaturase n=1 Tax=Yersinia mollaretii TaxID=33060 RepID=UPI0005E8DB4C|nr:fatty acid desaturase [Yersinia mollaretii]MDA5526734.1 fatty acid desaturase [Yersinia mollaretii]MDR7873525.1 fatty acid desaturase [Yersinia mollaretii]PHZ32199.1 fatty acid desaturase [Yersinia mollaretii]WQC76603.1 fatty acid desaturase [Yersinia mollaretii]CNF40200.1 putative fatty acid desaturase [Yersinia mollaretii]
MLSTGTQSDNRPASVAHYLSEQQRGRVKQLSRSWVWRLELPTWILIGVIYTGWFVTVIYWQQVGVVMGSVLLILLSTWYMSLQHELIHGHPTRWRWVNQLFGTLPLAVWYPYGLYRDSHIQHHCDENLTHPEKDPESYYYTGEQWKYLSPLLKRIVRASNTFLGRVVLGPVLDIIDTIRSAARAFLSGDRQAIAMWLVHLGLLIGLFHWIASYGISTLFYLLVVSYPALSLTKVRSFFEHRAVENSAARSTLNEAAWPWRLLFLNLNYHLVHHDLPSLPWYGLRQIYLENRVEYQHRSEQFVVHGYNQWLEAHAFTALEIEIHPFYDSEEKALADKKWHGVIENRRRSPSIEAANQLKEGC